MKNLLFCLLFSCLPFDQIIAQAILVEYENKYVDEMTGTNTIYYEVWITKDITVNRSKLEDSTKAFEFVKNKKEGFLYDNNKYMKVKDMYVKDSLHNFKWVLLPDTATILKRKCLAAKTVFRGREFKVFYTPELPVSDGPWKLGGLPGLILEAKSQDGYVSWRAIKLDPAYKGSFRYVDVSKNTYMDWSTYTEVYRKEVDKYLHKIRTPDDKDKRDYKIKAIIKKPSIEIFYPEIQTKKGIVIEY